LLDGIILTTGDKPGNVKIYFDGEMVLEHNIYFPYESVEFYLAYCCEGSAFDNMVVRDQVNETQSIK
jgi:hypothetical protein